MQVKHHNIFIYYTNDNKWVLYMSLNSRIVVSPLERVFARVTKIERLFGSLIAPPL